MKAVLKDFLVVCYAAYVVLAQGNGVGGQVTQSTTTPPPPPPPLDPNVVKESESQFIRIVDQSSRQNGGHRQRRSIHGLDVVVSPSSYRGLRRSSVYYDAPVVPIGGFEYLYDSPAVGYTRGGYYTGSEQWSFRQFYDSFRPLRAVLTGENAYVRDYYKVGSFHDCMSDFWRLGLTGVRPLTSDLLESEYGLGLGEVVNVQAARSSLSVASSSSYSLGYVGVMRDHPYVVLAVRSGCQLDGFPGFHDCLVFSGATYPYTNTVRRFVYVNKSDVTYTSVDRRYPGLRGLRGLSSLVNLARV